MRTRTTSLIAAAALAASALLVAPATTAQADERSCRSSLGAVTVDNLRIPSGAPAAP